MSKADYPSTRVPRDAAMGEPRYVRILRAFEEVDPRPKVANNKNCNHRSIICNEHLIKDTVENKLRPLLPLGSSFFNVKHIWDEEGTSCDLFAELVLKVVRLNKRLD